MKKIITFLCAVALVFGGVNTAGAVLITTYQDITAWKTDIGSTIIIEDFGNNVLNDGLIINSDVGYIHQDGYWWDQINDYPQQTTTFSFIPSIFAFGGIFDLAGPGGEGPGIGVSLTNGSTYSVSEIPGSTENTFWGFISDTPFTNVIFNEGNGSGSRETFNLDNLVYATAAAPVPEPGTGIIFLLGAGLVALSRSLKKRRNV